MWICSSNPPVCDHIIYLIVTCMVSLCQNILVCVCVFVRITDKPQNAPYVPNALCRVMRTRLEHLRTVWSVILANTTQTSLAAARLAVVSMLPTDGHSSVKQWTKCKQIMWCMWNFNNTAQQVHAALLLYRLNDVHFKSGVARSKCGLAARQC